MTRATPAQLPPDPSLDWQHFPSFTLTTKVSLYRSAQRPPGWYAAFVGPGGGGRFDLTAGRGTLYAALRDETAVRESLGASLLSSPSLNRKTAHQFTLWQTTATRRLRLAKLDHGDAITFGVTRELSTGSDYKLYQTWAEHLAAHGFDGIRYLSRFTSGSAAADAAVAVFSTAGAHLGPLHDFVEIGTLDKLATEFGIRIARTSTTTPPPTIGLP